MALSDFGDATLATVQEGEAETDHFCIAGADSQCWEIEDWEPVEYAMLNYLHHLPKSVAELLKEALEKHEKNFQRLRNRTLQLHRKRQETAAVKQLQQEPLMRLLTTEAASPRAGKENEPLQSSSCSSTLPSGSSPIMPQKTEQGTARQLLGEKQRLSVFEHSREAAWRSSIARTKAEAERRVTESWRTAQEAHDACRRRSEAVQQEESVVHAQLASVRHQNDKLEARVQALSDAVRLAQARCREKVVERRTLAEEVDMLWRQAYAAPMPASVVTDSTELHRRSS